MLSPRVPRAPVVQMDIGRFSYFKSIYSAYRIALAESNGDQAVPMDTWDVIVIGAGAAGLMAASHAAERGRRTLVLEKNKKPGVKILMSGGTRCNITQATDNRGIVAAYGPPGKFLHSALAAFSVQQTIDFFEAEGVPTKVEETGKIFPVSNKAADVLGALVRRLERSGAVLAAGEGVMDMQVREGRF